ncbi:MAG: hypothetical protein M3Z05_13100 [Gemmatimonadota bacterium]|nr:hypothetical protein [Gemmatimonadota bacterium]
MRLSRIFSAKPDAPSVDGVSMRRAALWALVWVALLAGIVLYFRYARFLTPLLA